MEHVLSLSYGKDSLACLGAIEQLGWPLDRIVNAEVWANDTIQADLPPEVVDNANIMKNNSGIILVREPFLLDDELKEKATKWVEWANKADPHEYDPFAKES